MKSLVIYATRSGNTRRIASAIADELRRLGPCDLLAADAAPYRVPAGTQLLVIGGPTEGHGMTESIERFLDDLEIRALDGIAAAAFDTRLRWPKVLSGSAAEGIARRLTSDGAVVVVPPESFIVTRKPALEPGEEQRATAWAAALATVVDDRAVAVVSTPA